MNRGSITKIDARTLKVVLDPTFLLSQPAFVRDGDNPVPIVPGYEVKEIIACIAWAQVAYKAPHLFSKDITEIKTTFQNGMYVIDISTGAFGLWKPS